MTVETHAHRARDRVEAEREATRARIDAYAAFERKLADISTTRTMPSATGSVPAAGPPLGDGGRERDCCQTVRRAFAETIRPHSVPDGEYSESVLETIREELSESIAIALSPATEAGFTDECKRSILARCESRRREATLLATTLDREAAALEDGIETIEAVTDWIATADETPLPELGFEDLRSRHRQLSTFRDRCADRARERQQFLAETTSDGGAVGIRHRDLLDRCYADFPVDHPLLATLVHLVEVCESCQRTVRAYLVRSG